MKFPAILLTLSFLFLSGFSARAGETVHITYDAPPPAVRSCFERGRWSSELLFEGYGSFSFRGDRPTINYGQGSYRITRMMTDLKGDGFWRSNYQFVAEGLYAGVVDGPGGWISGANLLLRRNFVSPNEKLTWYVQFGGGVVWNDIYNDRVQPLIGRSREFSGVAGLGLRYQLKNDWYFLLEANYRHLSNADTAPRNTGLDSLGGGIGIGRTF
jgi:hypothetical protein